jgi:hypothetical protein
MNVRAKQAAEKGGIPGEKPGEHPSGAKARPLLSATCGPTKVVLLLQNMDRIEFFRSL